MIMRRTLISGIATLLATASLTLSAYAQQSSTAFTYQGYLQDNNNPANGAYDLKFTLYDAASGGNAIGNPVFIEDLQISGGLFTVEVDFGTAPFAQGQRRWIEIAVRPGNSTRTHVALDPRIELTPVPYAIYAQNVANNAVSADQLANDPNALSKVSGGALSIVNGHIKRTNNVYFYATGLRDFGNHNNDWKYLLPSQMRSTQGFLPLAFDSIKHNIGGGIYTDVNDPSEPTQTVGEYTVPVSGYYVINVQVYIHVLGFTNSTVALQRKIDTDQWETLCAYYDYSGGTWENMPLHGVFYLRQGDIIRVAAYNLSSGQPLATPRNDINNVFSNPPFVNENNSLTIYLLSAADEPSN